MAEQAEPNVQVGWEHFNAGRSDVLFARAVYGSMPLLIALGMASEVSKTGTQLFCVAAAVWWVVRWCVREWRVWRYANRPFTAEELASIARIQAECRARRGESV